MLLVLLFFYHEVPLLPFLALTFINDVSELEEKAHASMNSNELESVQDQLIGLINTLNSAIMSSFFVVRRHVNIRLESSKIDNLEVI